MVVAASCSWPNGREPQELEILPTIDLKIWYYHHVKRMPKCASCGAPQTTTKGASYSRVCRTCWASRNASATGTCYVLVFPGTGVCKVGHTRNLTRRMGRRLSFNGHRRVHWTVVGRRSRALNKRRRNTARRLLRGHSRQTQRGRVGGDGVEDRGGRVCTVCTPFLLFRMLIRRSLRRSHRQPCFPDQVGDDDGADDGADACRCDKQDVELFLWSFYDIVSTVSQA